MCVCIHVCVHVFMCVFICMYVFSCVLVRCTLVEATAGMMFLTTPCVNRYVSPLIPNSSARSVAF